MFCEQCGKEGGRKRKGRPFAICVSCQNKLREEIKRWEENERRRTMRTIDLCPACGGKGEVMLYGEKIGCDVCRGTGTHRPSPLQAVLGGHFCPQGDVIE